MVRHAFIEENVGHAFAVCEGTTNKGNQKDFMGMVKRRIEYGCNARLTCRNHVIPADVIICTLQIFESQNAKHGQAMKKGGLMGRQKTSRAGDETRQRRDHPAFSKTVAFLIRRLYQKAAKAASRVS